MRESILDPSECLAEGPQSALEKRLIDRYLRDEGYRLEDLRGLTRASAKRLMKAACRYASLKLAEVEARARLLERIHMPP